MFFVFETSTVFGFSFTLMECNEVNFILCYFTHTFFFAVCVECLTKGPVAQNVINKFRVSCCKVQGRTVFFGLSYSFTVGNKAPESRNGRSKGSEGQLRGTNKKIASHSDGA